MKTQRKSALLGALLSASLIVGAGLVAAPAAFAASNDAKIVAEVGSYRNLPAGSVAPGVGVTMRLSSGSASSSPQWTEVTAAWGTCVSAANGKCEFTVPKSAADASTRFRVEMDTASEGFAPIASLATGSSRHELNSYGYTSEVLYENLKFNGGEGFNAKPGISYTYPSKNKKPTKVDQRSSGVWAQRATNPAMPDSCGLRVGVLVDLSESMSGSVRDLKTATKTFIQSLKNTPSTMSLFTFSDNARFVGSHSLMTGSGVEELEDAVDRFKSDGGTNWDAGFRSVVATNDAAADGEKLDVLLVLTDGAPSMYYADNDSRSAIGDYRDVDFIDNEKAIFSANSLKDDGTRVQIVGIGDNMSSTVPNLAAVSGGVDGHSTITDYTALAAELKTIADKQCAGTITVVKKTIEFGASVDTAVTAAGFEFTAAMTNGTLAQATQTSQDNGTAQFSWKSLKDRTAKATITETARDGYTLKPGANGKNASCVSSGAKGAAVNVTNGTAANSFTFSAPALSAITCTVINEKGPKAASVIVNKSWVINGVSYASDANLPIAVTSVATEGSTTRDYGVPSGNRKERDSVTITDTNSLIPAGLNCRYDQPASGLSQSVTKTLVPGQNSFDFVAKITCTTNLTASHSVTNGGASAATWTVSATSPSQPPLSGAANFGPSAATANASYTLSAVHTGSYAAAYKQTAWTCTTNGASALVTENSVKTPMGTNTVCKASSNTVVLTLVKDVQAAAGTTIDADDWALAARGENGALTSIIEVAGSATGDIVRMHPDATVTLSERVSSSDAAVRTTAERFVLDNLVCVKPNGNVLPAGADAQYNFAGLNAATCTFSNAEVGLDIVKTGWHAEPLLGGASTGAAGIPSGAAQPIASGTQLWWTYTVTNTGVLPVTINNLVDDQLAEVTCSLRALGSKLEAGESLDCTGTGPVN